MSDTLLLVHGAFHDKRCWNNLIPELEARGVRAATMTLYRGGLRADASAVQAEVDRLRADGTPVSVMGHSLGCAPVALLDPASLAAAIFLCGPIAGRGMPPAEDCALPAFFGSATEDADGHLVFDPSKARDVFYHACTRALADEAAAQLRPMRVYGVETLDPPLWKQVHSTYLVCSDDHCVDPAYQRKIAARLPRSESLDSDHSPMIGLPAALAEAVVRALDGAK